MSDSIELMHTIPYAADMYIYCMYIYVHVLYTYICACIVYIYVP